MHLMIWVSYQTVTSLVQPYLLSYHHVYADNFFVLWNLLNICMKLTRTTVEQSDQIANTFHSSLHVNVWSEVIAATWWTTEGVTACKWRDKRDVHMVSTNSDGGDTDVNVQWQRQQVTLQVPNMILLYNRHMGWVVLTITISTGRTTQLGTLGVAGGNICFGVWWIFPLWTATSSTHLSVSHSRETDSCGHWRDSRPHWCISCVMASHLGFTEPAVMTKKWRNLYCLETSKVNGQRHPSIYSFFPGVSPGYKIIEMPANLVYLLSP